MDPATIERFRRAVEDEWCNPGVTAAYRKWDRDESEWDRDESEWGRAARDLIMDRAGLAPGLKVLDVGSAHGEPGIAIAEAVGPSGLQPWSTLRPICSRSPQSAHAGAVWRT